MTSLVLLALLTPSATDVDYLKQIKPLLAHRCASCHGALAQKGKLRLDTADFIRKGGRSGPAVVAGKSGQSLLLAAVLGQDRTRMPPEDQGAALTAEQVAILRAWIDQGAKAPANELVPEVPSKHWAFQKVQRPGIPEMSSGNNPIDAFVGAEYQRLGLRPPTEAERTTLLRRVTLDLTGLPPTREQMLAFLADSSPDAYERLVERLLASPDHGERWARHWMDVWRYSDWYGRRQEKDWRNSSPTNWRWRDWIVNSIDADAGYDRMVREMLAADEIAPTDDAAQAATGFLVRNYYSLNFDTWMKDQVEHTAKAFLGLTLNCCHCHDHKFDPISQHEYFRFRAFFEPLGLRQDRWPGEPDPGPFKKYDYASSGKVLNSGLVRVLDERPDAKTRMYRLGNDRDFLERDPVSPGAPAIVGGDRLSISPVQLPVTASYPGLKAFVRADEIARLKASTSPSAEAELKALHARIAADDAKYGGGDVGELGTFAIEAEREAAVAVAEAALKAAKAKGEAKAIAAAETALANAKKPIATWTPLSPVYPTTSTGRRKALAEWITARDNPLTARVAVNHIWTRHFGKPLVESVFDFGLNGKRPSHPALLDWLAAEWMESGWSMKHLHRLIVTSQVYRASSQGSDEANRAKDADNRALWHYPSRRLEAEAVRDSLLFVAGELDPRRGGRELEAAEQATSRRRSLYFSCHPELGGSLKLLEFFDVPDPCDCYRRADTLVPQQALALTNSEFVVERSRALARRISGDDSDVIRLAFETLLSRPPTMDETVACREFLATQTKLAGRARAVESLIRVLFNHHDFVTLR